MDVEWCGLNTSTKMGNNRGLIIKVSTVAILSMVSDELCVEVGPIHKIVSGTPVYPPTHSFDFAGEESIHK